MGKKECRRARAVLRITLMEDWVEEGGLVQHVGECEDCKKKIIAVRERNPGTIYPKDKTISEMVSLASRFVSTRPIGRRFR